MPTARTWGWPSWCGRCRPGPAGPGGGTAAAAPGRGGLGPGPSSGATSPAAIGAGPVGVRAAWGALGLVEALAEPFLALSGRGAHQELGARCRRRAPPSPSSPGPQNSWLSQPCLPHQRPQPRNQPSCYGHTFYQPFQWGPWGLPILETGKLRISQEGGQRGANPFLQLSPFLYSETWKNRAKGERIEVKRSRPWRSGFPSWPLPGPGARPAGSSQVRCR